MNQKNVITTTVLFFALLFSLQAQHIKEYTPMLKSDFNSEDFGKGYSIGFYLFGEGHGFLMRKTLKSEHQIGVAVSPFILAITFLPNNEGIDRFRPGFFVRPEFNILLGSNFKEKAKKDFVKRKYKKHYLSIKPGAGLTFDRIYSLALTWHRERFDVLNKNYAHGLDIGIKYSAFDSTVDNGFSEGIGVFFRLDFNWYKN